MIDRRTGTKRAVSLSPARDGGVFVTLILVSPLDYEAACQRAKTGAQFGITCLVFQDRRLFEQAQQVWSAAN